MADTFEIQHHNPATLYDSRKYGLSQAVSTRGGRTIYVSGQVAFDAEGHLIGGRDNLAQFHAALACLRLALADAGAGPADVVQVRSYVVGFNPARLEDFTAALKAFFPAETPPAAMFLGVETLATADVLVEIECTAVVA